MCVLPLMLTNVMVSIPDASTSEFLDRLGLEHDHPAS